MDVFLGHILWKRGILFHNIPEAGYIFDQFKRKYFFKTQGSRLGTIIVIAPNKGVE